MLVAQKHEKTNKKTSKKHLKKNRKTLKHKSNVTF